MDDRQSGQDSFGGAQAVVKKKKGISFIWVLPIIAALIGAWLLYKGIVEAPIEVVINFDSAEGISVDKTKVLYKGIQMGMVSDVALNPDNVTVDVTVEFAQENKEALKDTTKFWLVKPRLTLRGVSGLGTVLGGDYIAMSVVLGKGKHVKKFKALPVPPTVAEDAPGLHLVLYSYDLATFEPGSPVYFEDIEVGDVENWKLVEEDNETEGKRVMTEIKIFIRPEYSHLVHEHTHFYNATGIEIEGGLTGFKVRTESLTTILLGGIEFTTPSDLPVGKPVQNGDRFELFKDYKEADPGIPIIIHFPTAEGLKEGHTEVRFKGVKVGYLKKYRILDDLTFEADVIMDPRAERGLLSDTEFWLVEPKLSLTGVSGLESLIGGKHIEMVVGLKGKPQRKFVALKDAPILSARKPGLHIKLIADELGSIGRETPVYYKKIKVGVVEGYELNKKTGKIEAQVFIEREFQHFVRKNSLFWNASGIDISGGLSGIKIRTESLESILSSGIAFYTPEDEPNGEKAQKGDTLSLYPDFESTQEVGGVPIKITFDSASGLGEGTKIKYHGITVGEVESVSFSPSLEKVILSARLDDNAATLAREGTQFWVVKVEFGLAAIRNLGTIVTGDYIAIRPTEDGGNPVYEFVGLRKPPVEEPAQWGLTIVLVNDNRGSISVGNKVFYRDIVVGEVTSYELADTGDHVRIYLNIQQRYAPLVRENSVFWNASGVDVNFGLFSGLEINTESFEAILAGGVAFATPDNADMGEQAKQNAVFPLQPKVEDEWRLWKPRIELGK
jgi:paraquat-inducible protein B